jgi:hypothetical protein
MSEFPVRSPAAKVRGLVYFGRMLDKIRVHAEGKLPPDYQANLGKGFDQNCTTFLRVDYQQIVARVQQGGTDEEILEWCYANGRRPAEDDVEVWNEFMRNAAGMTKSRSSSPAGRRKQAWPAVPRSRRCSSSSTSMKVARCRTRSASSGRAKRPRA